jgi:Skp family chaperone for outer membrane proteins
MKQTSTPRFAMAGWLVAGALVLGMAVSGFQPAQAKFGTVDMQKILSDSATGKKIRDDMQTEFNLRQGLLEFVDTHKVLSMDQAGKLRDLTLKANPTDAEKSELQKVKDAIIADGKQYNALMVKQNITEAERTQLSEFNNRRNNIQQLLQQWNQEFSQELSELQDQKIDDVLRKARDQVQALGKKDGYSVVFPSNVAVYGANDLTDAAIKAVDAAR